MDSVLRYHPSTKSIASRIILALIAVPVILVGMLLMHVFTSDGANASPPVNVVAVESGSAAEAEPIAGTTSVVPEPTLDQLACILALLVGMLVLALPAFLSRARGRLGATPVPLPHWLSPYQQPDLYVLSVSRI